MTRIYLIRHGTTEWNREEIFRGRAECALNETGVAEARAARSYFEGVGIDFIYTSPLSRAVETARIIAQGRGIQGVPDPAFIDLDFGEWQGLPLREARERYADLYRIWRDQPQDARFPGGENLAEVRSRSWERLLGIIAEHPEKTILIVSHRVITKILICAALGLDNSHFWQIKQDTTAINCLEHARGRFVLSLMNETCHLKSIHASGTRKDF